MLPSHTGSGARNQRVTLGALVLYIGSIIAANYLIVHGMPGATPTPFHTYTLPTLFGLVCPAGTYMAALTFPLRDIGQRTGGRWVGILAIVLAAVVSWWVSDPVIAIASGGTFLISESMDFLLYTPLQDRIGFPRAVVVSSTVAAIVDSLVFLQWSGIGYGHGELAGLIVAKLLIVVPLGYAMSAGPRRVLARPQEVAR